MSLPALLREVRACQLCAPEFDHTPRPVLQLGTTPRILIAGQAPGRRVQESGVPFDDPSGDRLREWLGLTPAQFYDPALVAILPMAFCYPGTGKSGDLPPPPRCAATWRARLLAAVPRVDLTLVIGQYALAWHLDTGKTPLTEVVRNWKAHRPRTVPLPHPSPRNNIWLKKNPWFETEVVPYLRRRVRKLLGDAP